MWARKSLPAPLRPHVIGWKWVGYLPAHHFGAHLAREQPLVLSKLAGLKLKEWALL